ncbi:MAG TPA: DUF222 domain-containing protein, partial [Micrococcaceae bacterium]|nr:DUF222 domain-containing protein [Micrococcaceae bacterium]
MGAAAAQGLLGPDALRISLAALRDARTRTTATGLGLIEESLAETAVARDPDFLAQVAQRWRHRLDQDGPEPSVTELAARQGLRLHGLRRGLYHLEIDADQYQYETVLTVLNAGTNPRTKNTSTSDSNNGRDRDSATAGSGSNGGDGGNGNDCADGKSGSFGCVGGSSDSAVSCGGGTNGRLASVGGDTSDSADGSAEGGFGTGNA